MYFLLHTHNHKKGSDGRKKSLGDQGQIQSKCSDILLSKFLLASSIFMFNQFVINSSICSNTIQFTHTQIEAIRAGMQPGLTMVRELLFY